MTKIIPQIAVSDMAASVAFYHSLGFVSDDGGMVDEYGTQWESLALGDANLWLIRQDIAAGLTPGHALGNGVTLFCSVDDVDELYNRVLNSDLAGSVTKEIETLWYGLRVFKMTDPNGYVLTFSTQVAQPQDEQSASRDGQASEQPPETQQLPVQDESRPIAVAYDGERERDIDRVQPGTRDTGPLPAIDDDTNETQPIAERGPIIQDEMVPYEPTDRTDTGRG